MNSILYGCLSLKELNLNKFITDKVTDMGYLFSRYILLKELNHHNFNTNNVTNMASMYCSC